MEKAKGKTKKQQRRKKKEIAFAVVELWASLLMKHRWLIETMVLDYSCREGVDGPGAPGAADC